MGDAAEVRGRQAIIRYDRDCDDHAGCRSESSHGYAPVIFANALDQSQNASGNRVGDMAASATSSSIDERCLRTSHREEDTLSSPDVLRQMLSRKRRAGRDQVHQRALEDDPPAVVAGAGAEAACYT